MAGVPFTSLLPLRTAPEDFAGEIGAIAPRFEIGAMCVGHENGAEGPLIYKGEVPIYVNFRWRILEREDGHHHRWWRLEIQVPRNNGQIKPGTHIVIAEHPYSNGWICSARFKSPSKKGKEHRTALPTTGPSSGKELVGWVENQEHDFWEKGDFLTAGISEPALPFVPGRTIRNPKSRALLVFGACEDTETYTKELQESQDAKRLIEATKQRKLTFWFKRAGLKTRPRLYDEVADEGLSLMYLSIRQALAGPHEEDSTQWIGQPVMKKADQIYREHLNNLNRQVSRRRY